MKELPSYATDGKVDSCMNGDAYVQTMPDHYLWCHVCNCYHDHVQAKSTACSNVNVFYKQTAYDFMEPRLRQLADQRHESFAPLQLEERQLIKEMFHAERYTDIEDWYLAYLGIFRDIDDIDLTP